MQVIKNARVYPCHTYFAKCLQDEIHRLQCRSRESDLSVASTTVFSSTHLDGCVPHIAKTDKQILLREKHIQVNCKKEEEQEPRPIAMIESAMKDLEEEISLRNTLANEQANPSACRTRSEYFNDLT
jgi:hypothetical protein